MEWLVVGKKWNKELLLWTASDETWEINFEVKYNAISNYKC